MNILFEFLTIIHYTLYTTVNRITIKKKKKDIQCLYLPIKMLFIMKMINNYLFIKMFVY
jgi:hypothetical protein